MPGPISLFDNSTHRSDVRPTPRPRLRAALASGLGVLVLMLALWSSPVDGAEGARHEVPSERDAVGMTIPGRVSLVLEEDGTDLPDAVVRALEELTAELGLGGAEVSVEGYAGLRFLDWGPELPRAHRDTIIARLHPLPSVRFASEVRDNGAAFHLPHAVPIVPMPELLVVVDDAAVLPEVRAQLASRGLRLLDEFPAPRGAILHVGHDAPGTASAALAHEIAAWTGVASAEVNAIEHMPPLSVPNDPLFASQWALRNTGQNAAWTPGADLNATLAWDLATGSASVVIAIIDEGVDVTHPDLASRLAPGYDATDQLSPAGIPGNCLPDDEHGTACAGIAAAAGNDGVGIAGVCWNATILPVRIGYGTHWSEVAWQVDALTWATDQGADVLSNSWGSTIPSNAVQTAIQYATGTGRGGLGCAVLFASGNTNGPIVYPAKYPETIAVGASSPCDERTSPTSCDGETFWGSCHGLELDLVAPGVKLMTTDVVGPTGRDPGDYIPEFNGTSAACPYAAGGAALLLSLRPDLTAGEIRTFLTSACLDGVGNPVEDVPGWDPFMGWGRLDLRALLELATAPDPVAAFDCVVAGDSVTLNWTAGGTSYDSFELRRNGSIVTVLPGTATTTTEVAVPPGSQLYTLVGISGGAASPHAICSAFLLSGATDLVWNPPSAAGGIDGGAALAGALLANGMAVVSVEDIGAAGNLDLFDRIWVNLGVSPANHVLTEAEALLLVDYLTNGIGGASLYLEGADTWAFDPPTTLHPLFRVDGYFDGLSDLDTVSGFDVGATDLSFVSMPYGGENAFIDELAPIAPAVTLLRNGPFATYDVAIYHDATDYRTIGASLEFGGLFDTPTATRTDLMAGMLEALTIPRTPFLRGDANGNGLVNLADAVLVLGYLFSGAQVNCLDAIDVNDNGSLNVADAVALLSYLFSSGSPPITPFPTIGIDPTDTDGLDCASYP